MILNDFSDCSIFVIGDLMLDEYVVGENYKISDEAPVPILKVDEFKVFLGGASNVAKNIVDLGANVILCGAIGRGYSSKRFLNLLHKSSLNDSFIIKSTSNWMTTKTRVIINEQQVVRYDYEHTGLKDIVKNKIIDIIQKFDFNDVDLILVSDYNKGVVTNDILDLLRSKTDKPIILDPVLPFKTSYYDLYCMTPNLHEYNSTGSFEDLCLQDVQDILGLKHLVVTLGSNGAKYCDEGKEVIVPVNKKEVTNCIGAGDTFVAALSSAIASGHSMHEAVSIANVAASIVVSKMYTRTCSLNELRKEIEHYVFGKEMAS